MCEPGATLTLTFLAPADNADEGAAVDLDDATLDLMLEDMLIVCGVERVTRWCKYSARCLYGPVVIEVKCWWKLSTEVEWSACGS
jgi:hypothetical protein